MPPSGPPRVSIVTPCFNEAECLAEFHARASAAAQAAAGDAHEIVIVDDGSSDGGWEIMAALAARDPHVVAVRLMRNHGHQLAATAGLSLARGARVMLIDADLQDPPELLLPMMAAMDEGAEVVYGQRTRREAETWFKRVSAAAFYRLLGRMSGTPIPRDTGDFRLMSRRVVEVLGAMPERQRFLRGMVSWVGGRQVALPYERRARHAGTSKYPLAKMVRFAADALTSFSTSPLRVATWFGLGAAGLAVLLLAYSVLRWVQGGTVTGWSSLMGALAGFSAVQLIVLGIIGEYLGRLFQEVKGRPLFIVDQVVAGQAAHALPTDFARMPPQARQATWDAIREAANSNRAAEHAA